MWFKLKKSDLSFIDTAPYSVKNEIVLPLESDAVFHILATHPWENWFDGILLSRWLTDAPHGLNSRREVELARTSIKERFIAWEEGHRFSFSFEEMTFPFTNKMIEDIILEPLDNYQTKLRYEVYYSLPFFIYFFKNSIEKAFDSMFKQSLKNLLQYIEKPPSPPWIEFPQQSPTWGGWRQGNAEEWLLKKWLPYWNDLSHDNKLELLESYPPPDEEWNQFIDGT